MLAWGIVVVPESFRSNTGCISNRTSSENNLTRTLNTLRSRALKKHIFLRDPFGWLLKFPDNIYHSHNLRLHHCTKLYELKPTVAVVPRVVFKWKQVHNIISNSNCLELILNCYSFQVFNVNKSKLKRRRKIYRRPADIWDPPFPCDVRRRRDLVGRPRRAKALQRRWPRSSFWRLNRQRRSKGREVDRETFGRSEEWKADWETSREANTTDKKHCYYILAMKSSLNISGYFLL